MLEAFVVEVGTSHTLANISGLHCGSDYCDVIRGLSRGGLTSTLVSDGVLSVTTPPETAGAVVLDGPGPGGSLPHQRDGTQLHVR